MATQPDAVSANFGHSVRRGRLVESLHAIKNLGILHEQVNFQNSLLAAQYDTEILHNAAVSSTFTKQFLARNMTALEAAQQAEREVQIRAAHSRLSQAYISYVTYLQYPVDTTKGLALLNARVRELVSLRGHYAAAAIVLGLAGVTTLAVTRAWAPCFVILALALVSAGAVGVIQLRVRTARDTVQRFSAQAPIKNARERTLVERARKLDATDADREAAVVEDFLGVLRSVADQLRLLGAPALTDDDLLRQALAGEIDRLTQPASTPAAP